MKYGSVCSGIEAASVAWEPLGWDAQWFSEIEQFPSAVLAHRFPSVPNLGDMTKIHETQIFNDSTIDILVGGTPCQSFSVAGLRKGLTDPRGNLMLTFLSLAQRKKPRWIVWENVPGVLSSNGGRDFGTFLQALAECGYGFAYRVLDAQYFGVAQRRRRVFVVGYLGDWRPAGAVLFEQDCLSGNTKKSREKRKATSTDVKRSIGCGSEQIANHLYWRAGDQVNSEILKNKAGTLNCNMGQRGGISWWNGEQTASTLTKQNANGAQRMPDKDNFGAVLTPIAVDTYNYTTNEATTQTIRSQNDTEHIGAVLTPPTIIDRAAFNQGENAQYEPRIEQGETMSSLVAKGPHAVSHTMAIRRLTPTECERLQGFPDEWTKIPYRNKPEEVCPDGPRYKACGNSMAVPVMRWIGQRIEMVEELLKEIS
jgi:DNA (cytosine-5)-methyltransferase 1